MSQIPSIPSPAGIIDNARSKDLFILGSTRGLTVDALTQKYFKQSNQVPSTTMAGDNAMIEIHSDNHDFVKRQWLNAGFTRLRFQSIEDDITESVEARYEENATIGRSEPYVSYEGTGSRRIPLSLLFACSLEQGDRGRADTAERCARWLQSLAYPSYTISNTAYPPPLCRLILGRSISARVIASSVNVTRQRPWAGFAQHFEYPMVVKVDIDFMVVNRKALSAADFIPSPDSAIRPVQYRPPSA